MIVALILGWILAVTGWLAFWAAQDQASELRKERDRYRARLMAFVIDRAVDKMDGAA